MKLNAAVDSLSLPPIPAVATWANNYGGEQGSLLDLSQAVPDYPPADSLLGVLGKAAASPAMARYGAIEGEAVLRTAYASHLSEMYAGSIAAENVHITAGCNQAFVTAP